MPASRQNSIHAYWRQKLGGTLLLVAVSAFGFLYIDAHNASMRDAANALPLATRADALIPFRPEFVFAYLLYYPWLFLPLVVLREREPFFRALGAFALMQSFAGVAFVLLPSHMVRPSVVPAGVAGDLVSFIYRLDMGWNVFPSLHVGHSTLVALLFWRHERKFFPVLAVGSALISVSTVLIKQHYVLDIPAGLLLASVCYGVSGLELPAAGEPAGLLARSLGRVENFARNLPSRQPDSEPDSRRG